MRIDLSHLRTHEGLARGIFDAIKTLCDGEATEMVLLSPDESERLGYGKCWRVMWESGPYEWGVNLSLSFKFFNHEFILPDNLYLETYYAFDVGIYSA